MVTCIPETPRFASEAERTVWQHLRAHLRQGDVLVANQRFTDVTKDHEIDLLVLLEGYGVVAVEVKGGSISHERARLDSSAARGRRAHRPGRAGP